MRRTALVSTLAFGISSIGTGTIDAQQGPDGPSFKKMFNDLMADAAQEGGKADILYSLATKPFFIDPAAAKAGKAADGRLLPASEAKVLGREGDWLNVRIEGWQQEQEGRVMYALRGQRILTAAVAPSAAAKVERGEGVRDPGTDLTWYKAGLTAWISKDAMIASREKLWAYGGEMYASSCGSCHSLRATNSVLANQWIGNLNAMKRFIPLDQEQYRLLLKYLQFHAKDTEGSNG